MPATGLKPALTSAKRIEEGEKLASRRMISLRTALGLPVLPTSPEALRIAELKAEYEKRCDLHYSLRTPLYIDRVERIALHGRNESTALKAAELMLRMFFVPYQKLLYGNELKPNETIGSALRDILRRAGESGRARIIERVVEVETGGDATDAKDSAGIEEGDSAKASSGAIVEGQAQVQ